MIEPARAACAELAALGIDVDPDELAVELARRAAEVGAEGLHALELGLAWACLHLSEAAIAHFERTYVPQATRALARMKLGRALIDDVLGWMRFELLVRPEGALLATYSGRGELGSWVRAIAVHEALKRARRDRREVSADLVAELPVPEPELVAMRGAYGPQFTRALSDGVAALSPGERTLLRQYFLDGLTIDILAGLYKIHRATAARRVAAARTQLVDLVRASLTRELGLSEAGVDQVITLSNLDESLGQLLRRSR